MLGFFRDWRSTIDLAPWVFEFERVQELAAKVTLIAIGFSIAAERTLSLNKSIRQERIMLLTVKLSCHVLLQITVLIKLKEDFLSNLCLQLSGGATESIETDIEPLVDISVDGVIFIAELLWGALFNESSCLRSGAIFISAYMCPISAISAANSRKLKLTTHIERVVSTSSTVPCEHIG